MRDNLPEIVPKNDLEFHWFYRDDHGRIIALVARFFDYTRASKKKFHQYHVNKDENWVGGAPTPLSLYGLHTLPKTYSGEKVFIFEGEKCTTASHYLGLAAITSMMGSNHAMSADWAILAKYRHQKEFVLIPDNDEPGKKYMLDVYKEVQKACPHATIYVCQLPSKEKGDDFIEWIQSNFSCMSDWDGFSPISEKHVENIKSSFLEYINAHLTEANSYFHSIGNIKPDFEVHPEPIQEVLYPVLPCPLHTLPLEIVNWVSGVATQMQISHDYLIAPLFVIIGSLIGSKRCLRLRTGTSWIEYSNLWGMSVGRSSMMKSPAMNAVVNILKHFSDRAINKYKICSKQYQIDLEAWRIRKKVREDVYKKLVKESIEANPIALDDPKIKFVAEEMPVEPKEKRYKTQDATVEKIGELLLDNPQGLLIFRDELSGWLQSFEKAGRENDRKFFLESWSGKQDFDVDRIGRGTLHIPALFLSIFGGIQPGPLSQYIRAAIKGGGDDDGLIQRFQIMVWPDAKETWELVSNISIPNLEQPIKKIFECLDALIFDQDRSTVMLSFNNEAQELFDQWQGKFERNVRSGILFPYLESHLVKYKKLLPALCLIIEHLKHAVFNEHPHMITLETLKSAMEWLNYFESHAFRVYGSGANTIHKVAKDLLKRLRQGDIEEPFTARDVYYAKHWTGLANAEQVEEVLSFLIEKHYLICEVLRTGGRSTTKYWVHPDVFEKDA